MRRLVYILPRRRRGRPAPTWHQGPSRRPIDVRLAESEPEHALPEPWDERRDAPNVVGREIWER